MTTIKGFSTAREALQASKRVNSNPRAVELRNGTYLGLGEELLSRDGTRSQLVHGADGASAEYADVAHDVERSIDR